jgi:hypothetical protein
MVSGGENNSSRIPERHVALELRGFSVLLRTNRNDGIVNLTKATEALGHSNLSQAL